MTQDEIADIYQKANGWSPRAYPNTMTELEAFVELATEKERAEFAVHAVDIARRAVAAEREACAKVCDDVTWEGPWKSAAVALSNLIRARG